MSKRLVAVFALIVTICFLGLGMIFKSTAKEQQGVSASTGVLINGEFVETSTGRIGADKEKYETFNTGGTIFYVLGGITGIICIVAFISSKRSEEW